MTEDIIKRAKALVDRFQSGYESPPVNPIILDLIAEIEHLREQTDWQHKNALKWRETCDELEDEKNQWKGRYLELKEDREQEMSDEDKKEIIDLDAELTAKDIEIERLRSQLEESQIKYGVDIASTDLHWQDEIAAKDARIKELEADNRRLEARVEYCHDQTKLIERLEAAFLEVKSGALYCDSRCRYRTRHEHCDYDDGLCEPYSLHYIERCPIKNEWKDMAREALERIKEGGKDD